MIRERVPRRALGLFLTVTAALALMALWLGAAGAARATVSGVVQGPAGPLAGARVRVRATDNATLTDAAGQFQLADLEPGQGVEVTAWYTGYYIASVVVTPTISGVVLLLRPHHQVDHPDYDWTPPISTGAAPVCGDCHPMILEQWAPNAHGGAVSNDRFFSLYAGTDLNGSTVVTPGYLTDFPGTAGNCASCHAPGWGVDGYLTTSLLDARGVVTAGIHCDFCHKVGGVYLDPTTGSVYPNAPGVESQRLFRPPAGDNIFFGPFDDVPDPDVYLPLMAESAYCAPCHQFSFWGTPIYESYAEWLASPYADAGVTCQTCHMAPNGDIYFALPEVGGLPHPPEQIPSHAQPGAADVALLQETVMLTASAAQVGDSLQVTITVTNSGAGHHVPTDHPGRHLLLLVSATANGGAALPHVAGPVVPAWGGAVAGRPGLIYAKVLEDVASGRFPVVSYWAPSFIRSDNRIPALGASVTTYAFALPADADLATVQAEVIFRRLFEPEANQRGWPLDEIVMATVQVAVPVQQVQVFAPVVRR